jgi:hypothetical protein
MWKRFYYGNHKLQWLKLIMKKVIIVLMITCNICNHKTDCFIELILLKKILLLQ